MKIIPPSMIMEENVGREVTPIKADDASNKMEEDAKNLIDRNLNQCCASDKAEEDTNIKNETHAKGIDMDLSKHCT